MVKDINLAKRLSQQEKRIKRRGTIEAEIVALEKTKKAMQERHQKAMNAHLGKIRKKKNALKRLKQEIHFETVEDIDPVFLKAALSEARQKTKEKSSAEKK